MMILPMIASMQAITQSNNATFGAMQAQEAQMNLVRNLDFNSIDTFTPSFMANLYQQEQNFSISKLLNDTMAKIANANLKALEKWKNNDAPKYM